MKNKKRKGFTLVELLVVIAIIAILATVSILGYTSFTKKATISNDEAVCSQINLLLQADEQLGKPNTLHDALQVVMGNGYDVTKLTPTTQGYNYVYHMDKNRFELVEKLSTGTANDWIFVDAKDANDRGYSVYLVSNNENKTELTVNAGVDVGDVSIASINYTNSTEQKAVIRTNNGSVSVNAANGIVSHYGYANGVNIEAVADDSYHEYGIVAVTVIKAGHYVAESGSVVYYLDNQTDIDATIMTGANVKTISTVENPITQPNCNNEHNFGAPYMDGEKKYHICNVCGHKEEIVGGVIQAATQEALVDAITKAEDGDTIKLSAGTYNLPSEIAGKKVIIEGNGETTFVDRTGVVGSEAIPGLVVTMSNVTIKGGTEDYKGWKHTSEENYVGCKFTGKTFFYAEKMTFTNCTFEQSTYDYCFWTYGCSDCTFNNCTFNTVGKAAKVYNEATSGEFNIKFNGCTFNTSNTSKNKPAIAVNSLGAQFNIIITNCTANDFANGTSIEDDAMTSWYTNRMANASESCRKLIGCEGSLDKISVTIDGTAY